MNAATRLLIDHIDIWTGADNEKKSSRGRSAAGSGAVYGIKKLRELILELAVRGKLVPQDPNDEPASELLLRQGQRQTKAKKQFTSSLKEALDQNSFALPSTWEWVDLPEISTYKVGKTPSTKSSIYWTERNDGVNWVSIADLNDDGEVTDTAKHVSQEAASEVFRSPPSPAGTILMSFKLTLGKVSVLRNPAYHNEAIISVFPTSAIFDRYLFKVLPSRAQAGKTKSAIKGNTLNSESIAALQIPLPPLAEQHRIVAKVDELMALCDQLEAQHSDAAEAHEKLVKYLLSTLTNSENAEAFAANWQRIAAHFDTLFTTENSIDALKQTILQLAVMGKLVPQDPNDEPARTFLQRLNIGSTPSDVGGWAQVYLGKLGETYGGATPSKGNATYWGGDIPWVSPKDMKRAYIDDAEDRVSERALNDTSLKLLPVGSLLMVVRGMILAHSFPVALTTKPVTINQDMKALSVPSDLRSYLFLFLRAQKDHVVSIVDRSSHGTCKLLSDKLWALTVSIPPVAEQHRIVAKVDEMMTFCDALKSRLSAANQFQQKLADALVAQVVA